MKLCDNDIRKWINNGKIKISPKLSLNKIHGATIDVRLGNQFRTLRQKHTISFIDLSKSENSIKKKVNYIMNKEIFLKSKERFFLHPKELTLALTLESIKLPSNIIGWLNGKSSLARLGLMIHITSHCIDPGWDGKIVLELYNVGKIPLVLRPGILIGSITFEILSNYAKFPYNQRKDAKYKNQKNCMIF